MLLTYLVNILEGGVAYLLGQYFGGRSNSVTWSIYGREEGVTQLLGQYM